MGYGPAIKSAKSKQQFQLANYSGILFGDIEGAGRIEYLHVLVIFDENQRPCFFVTSEVNATAKQLGGGSHFLCVFDGDRHLNYGSSDDWADEAKFCAEALRIVRKRFGSQT